MPGLLCIFKNAWQKFELASSFVFVYWHAKVRISRSADTPILKDS